MFFFVANYDTLFNDICVYVSQVMSLPAQPRKANDKVKEMVAASDAEYYIVEENSDIDSVVQENTEALTQHMFENSGLHSMANAVDLLPLKMDDLVDTRVKAKIGTSSAVNQTKDHDD